jgi:hypothetical protein
MDNIGQFLRSIVVRDCGLTKIRIGNPNDGGYVCFQELCERSRTVYSAGVGGDIGFEEDWAQRWPKTKFMLFDPNIDELPRKHNGFTLHKLGLGLKWKPLKKVDQDSTLKMDIEWDEYGALQVFEDEELRKFSQMLIEFHIVHAETPENLSPYFSSFYDNVYAHVNQDLFGMYLGVMQRLNNWFWIFHVHANNSLPLANADGYYFPPLLEVSFVRKDLVKQHSPTKANFPILGLDQPNKTNRPDIMDYYPLVTGDSTR